MLRKGSKKILHDGETQKPKNLSIAKLVKYKNESKNILKSCRFAPMSNGSDKLVVMSTLHYIIVK